MVVDEDSDDGSDNFETFHGERFSRMTFVFTGQGAQWPGMGKALMASFDAFLNAIRQMDNVLQSLTEPPSWSIEGSDGPITVVQDAHLTAYFR